MSVRYGLKEGCVSVKFDKDSFLLTSISSTLVQEPRV